MIVKVTIVLLVVLAATALMRRAAAATRHAILVAGQITALVLPLLANVVPPIEVRGGQPILPVLASADSPWTGKIAGPPPSPSINYWPWLWLLGTLTVATARILSYIRAAMLVRRADGYLSDEIDQPVTFFSRIVLPRSARTWDDMRLRAVLLHEGAHVARRDTLLGLAGDVVCAVYWFHPLAWLSARRARLERERACDDAVLEGGIAPTEYATALLDVARHAHRGLGMAMAEHTHLGRRIAAILDSEVNRRTTRAARAAVLAATLTAAPLLAALTTLSIPLPRSGEPDLRGDAVASPFSEQLVWCAPPACPPPTGTPETCTTPCPDAAFIATMQRLSTREPQSPIDFVADRARWALGRVEEGELVAPLIDALSDSDWRVRAYAAWALAYSGDNRATRPIETLLDDDIWRVRAMAAFALRNLADPAAADSMKRALSDDAWQVRSQAVHYFAATGGSRELFETMIRDRHIAVRSAAEEALR